MHPFCSDASFAFLSNCAKSVLDFNNEPWLDFPHLVNLRGLLLCLGGSEGVLPKNVSYRQVTADAVAAGMVPCCAIRQIVATLTIFCQLLSAELRVQI